RSKTSSAWSSRSVCWPVSTTRVSTASACASSARTTGASLMPSGRVPTTTRTLGRSAIRQPESKAGIRVRRLVPRAAWVVRGEGARSPALPPPLPPAPRIRLGVLLSHELGEEAEAEQQHAHHLEQDHEVEERAEAERRHGPPDAQADREQTHEHAQASEDQAAQPEQEHGLAGEEEEERDRDQVEQADDDTAAPGVLGLAVPPGMQCDVDLGDAEPAGVREHDEEAMPVEAQEDLVQDLATERLHRVEDADGNAEEPAIQPVVDAGDQALLVAAHLAARDDVP